MSENIEKLLIKLFGLLSRASARKKVYSQKAMQEGSHDAAHLLRAISESEKVQAHRLFNSLRGRIDSSGEYIETIFEKEIELIIREYSEYIKETEGSENKAIFHALSQLRAAERRIMSFYSKDTKKLRVGKDEKYCVCKFCGYINTGDLLESCPICGARKQDFREVG